MDEIVAFTKYVGVFFMAVTAFIGFLFTILGFIINRNHQNELSLAKRELKDWVEEQGHEINRFWDQNSNQIERVIEHKMNISMLEYGIETDTLDSDRVYILLSRLMRTISRKDVSTLMRVKNINIDSETSGLLEKLMEEAQKYKDL